MPRDPDGKPIETRGRRSVSQRSRDYAEKLRSYGTFFESSPRLLETIMTGAFVSSFVYFLRPQVVAFETPDATTRFALFRGRKVSKVQINYPDRAMARNVAVLAGLVAAPNAGGPIGSLIAPAFAAGIFAELVEKTFPTERPDRTVNILGFTFGDAGEASESFDYYALAFGPNGAVPGGPGDVAVIDTTVAFYLKIILPRFLRALLLAAFFYIILRYVRSIGRN